MLENAKLGIFLSSTAHIPQQRRAIERLESSIKEAEKQLIECNTAGWQQNLQMLRRDLGLSLQEQAKGALIRA